MSWFIFIGDMLVMLFMTILVVWMSVGASAATLDFSARIPLEDEEPELSAETPAARGKHG